MDTSPALLLLLTLGFCQSLEIKVSSPQDIRQLQLGQKLELQCRTDRHSGAFWIRQDTSGTLHFIVFISSTSKTTFEGSQRTSTRFEASREGLSYHLVVKYFTLQDQGKYFCVMNFNHKLHFSPGQYVFLPGSSMQADLDHSCLVFLWVRLASLCFLLLQLLGIAIVLCRHRLTSILSRLV